MRKPLREQSECMPDDDTNSQLSDSLKKLNDIAQNITNFNFWLDVLPSKTMDKILYVSKSIGKAFLDPTIAVSLIEFACAGYTKKEIRNSVALSSIDAVRNVLMARKFGDMIVDKINVRKNTYKPKMIDTIEDLYPNLKKYNYDFKYPFFVPFFPQKYMWILGKSYWTKKPINVFIRQLGKNVTIRVVDTNVLFRDPIWMGCIDAMDCHGEPVRFSSDVDEKFFYALFELDIDDDTFRLMATYALSNLANNDRVSVIFHLDSSYGSAANRKASEHDIRVYGEQCGTQSSMTVSQLIGAAFLQQCLIECRRTPADQEVSVEHMDNEQFVYGFKIIVLNDRNLDGQYTDVCDTVISYVNYADLLSSETNDGKMVMDGVKYVFEHGGHRGYAFVGKPGSGKTTLMNRIMQEFSDKANFVILRKDDLGAMNPNLVSELCSLLGNVIIVVDDIDSVDFAGKNNNVDVLIRLFSDLNMSDCNYVFICTANNASKINKCLIGRAGRIDEVVNFDGVTSEEAKKFFEDKFSGQDFNQSCERLFQQIQDEGMTYSDLGNLVQLVKIYFDGKVTCDSLSFAIKRVVDTKKLSNNADTV